MDVVVTGRHCELGEGFRSHVTEKLGRLEKHDHRIIRVHVEVDCEPNPRQADRGVHVELTAYSKGPVIRAEAAADDKMGALDLALDKMAAQMRRAADRRRVHHRRRTPVLAGAVLPDSLPESLADFMPDLQQSRPEDATEYVGAGSAGSVAVDGEGPLVVREKVHAAQPMTLEQALYEMELVGHDFYLYADQQGRPAVVYRRRGYDYGVISLDLGGSAG